MAFNNGTQRNGYQGRDGNNQRQSQYNNQYGNTNRQNRWHDDSRRNVRGSNSYGAYQGNKYQKDGKKSNKRESFNKYDNNAYQVRNKYNGSGYGNNYNGYNNYNSNSKHPRKAKPVEKKEDIINDIIRIEKEIQLELEIIRTTRVC